MATVVKPKQPAPQTERGGGGLIARTRRWGRDVWLELKRVTKPTPQETTQMTIAVCLIVIVFSIWLGALDFLLTRFTFWFEQSILKR